FAVADHHVLPLLLAANRRDGAVDVILDADNACLTLRLVRNGRLPHAEELADQDRQQMRGAAHAAGENAGEGLHALRRDLLIDEQRRGPVSARHDPRQVHHRRGCPPRSGSGLRSADDRRATKRRDKRPCNCTTAPSRLSTSILRSTFHSRIALNWAAMESRYLRPRR